MGNKYRINYKLIFSVYIILTIIITPGIWYFWQKGIFSGIIALLFYLGILAASMNLAFGSKRVKSVTVSTNEIILEIGKQTITIPFKNCVKIEHYKHGPATERVYIFAKDLTKDETEYKVTRYEIDFDLRGFQDMCRRLYKELSFLSMEHIADDWFQKKFGGRVSYKDLSPQINIDAANTYSANFRLMWALMVAQFILALCLIILLWTRPDVGLNIFITLTFVFFEYLGVLVIKSPEITRHVTVNESSIAISYKKERVEIPHTSIQMISYQRPWMKPKRVYIFTKQMQCVLLPWYIKNFRRMSKSICKAMKDAKLERNMDKVFMRKYGK